MTATPRMLPMAPDAAPGQAPVFERIAVVGLGLIGGSIALAARRAWPSALVIGVDRNAVLEQAVLRHAVDVAAEDLMIISGADLVVLAMPVGGAIELLPALDGHLSADAVVTDVGSTKSAIVAAARSLPPRLRFVGGHPVVDSPARGIEAARADLFAGRPWILIDEGGGRPEVVGRLSAFAEGLGAKAVMLASAAEHDRLMAFVGHLPRLAAGALLAVASEAVGDEGVALAGPGLRESADLAAGRADALIDVCRTSGEEIGAAIDAYVAALQELRRDLAGGAAIGRFCDAASGWQDRLSGLDNAGRFPAS